MLRLLCHVMLCIGKLSGASNIKSAANIEFLVDNSGNVEVNQFGYVLCCAVLYSSVDSHKMIKLNDYLTISMCMCSYLGGK